MAATPYTLRLSPSCPLLPIQAMSSNNRYNSSAMSAGGTCDDCNLHHGVQLSAGWKIAPSGKPVPRIRRHVAALRQYIIGRAKTSSSPSSS
jgi:hypothetical protein